MQSDVGEHKGYFNIETVLRQELELEKAKIKLEEEKAFEIKPVKVD